MNVVVDWLNCCLLDVKHETFKDVTRVSDAEIKPMGDGQIVIISNINKATLTFETADGKKRTLKAIAKLEPPPGPGWEMAKQFNAFSTEIMMYSDVLKSMEMLMTEAGEKDTLWPECYHCGDNKLLIEDLCEIGYKVVPTYQFLDVEHALLVMKSIGKFHAFSMVMKDRSVLNLKDIGAPYYSKQVPFMEALQLKSLDDLVKTIREKWGSEWSSVPDRLLKYFGKPNEVLHDAWKSSVGKWDVLNHGDFSMRNMLFHYPSDSSIPDGIKFVDFQMSHYSNLGNDLVTLLYSSMKPNVREENMKLLLETYVENLMSTAEANGYKGPLPTVSDVEECIRSLHPVSFLMTLFTLPTFVISGKRDLQKQTAILLEKYETVDAIIDAQNLETGETFYDYLQDEDVTAFLKFDLQRLVDNNVI